jgi:hypothetical protein
MSGNKLGRWVDLIEQIHRKRSKNKFYKANEWVGRRKWDVTGETHFAMPICGLLNVPLHTVWNEKTLEPQGVRLTYPHQKVVGHQTLQSYVA